MWYGVFLRRCMLPAAGVEGVCALAADVDVIFHCTAESDVDLYLHHRPTLRDEEHVRSDHLPASSGRSPRPLNEQISRISIYICRSFIMSYHLPVAAYPRSAVSGTCRTRTRA